MYSRAYGSSSNSIIRQKLRGSFYQGWFSQRGGSSYWRPWGEVWGGDAEGKGEGGGEGGGWDGDRQRNRQVNAHEFVKTTL